MQNLALMSLYKYSIWEFDERVFMHYSLRYVERKSEVCA